jgi:hypothetical protein
MLSTEQINDLHRLYWSEHWPIRKIERQLNIGWKTIRKYLDEPAQKSALRDRPSKLDPFKAVISEWIEKDPTVTAAVGHRAEAPRPGIRRRSQHSQRARAEHPPEDRAPPRFCPHGTYRRGTLRG